MITTLRKDKVPLELARLIPIAQKWGIPDDIEREEAIAEASPEELDYLVHSLDGVADENFYGWLAGKESFNPNPSQEYVAFSALALAIESARLKLKSV